MISKIKYRQVRPLRRHLPPRQLRVRAVRGRQQLGQGTLHRGRGAGGQRAGRGEEGGRELRLSAGKNMEYHLNCHNNLRIFCNNLQLKIAK